MVLADEQFHHHHYYQDYLLAVEVEVEDHLLN